jgi:lipoate---protein ligase
MIEIVRGTAAQLHAREFAGMPSFGASWNVVTAPALVLGSAQPIDTIDQAVASAKGIEVVRRRSGGGSVLMLPGEMCWLDVVVPRGDPRWSDDVGRAMWWLGDVWVAALAACGIGGSVHHGGLEGGDLARVVCFAGRGAGEVIARHVVAGRVVAGRSGPTATAKLVGISQRRTREAARLQSSLHLVWRPQLVADLIADAAVTEDVLAPLVAAVDISAERLLAELEAALHTF